MKHLLLCISALYLLAPLSRAVSFCTPNKEMCLTTTIAGENMQFEVVSKVKGWVAIGFGPSMENTDMIVSYYIPRRRVDGSTSDLFIF
jgi:hypothetical protein